MGGGLIPFHYYVAFCILKIKPKYQSCKWQTFTQTMFTQKKFPFCFVFSNLHTLKPFFLFIHFQEMQTPYLCGRRAKTQLKRCCVNGASARDGQVNTKSGIFFHYDKLHILWSNLYQLWISTKCFIFSYHSCTWAMWHLFRKTRIKKQVNLSQPLAVVASGAAVCAIRLNRLAFDDSAQHMFHFVATLQQTHHRQWPN